MLFLVASPGTRNWGTCPSGVCECMQILKPFKLWMCLSFCRFSSKLYRQSHLSPENNFYLILPKGNIGASDILVSLIFWDEMSVSHHFQNSSIAPMPSGAKFWRRHWFCWSTAILVLQYELLLNPKKYAIVYFGTHGRLRQSISPSPSQIIAVGCRSTVNVSDCFCWKLGL